MARDGGPAKTYRIETIKDFDAVPDESIDACLADFAEYTVYRRLATALLSPDVAKPTNVFIWVDDGVSGATAIRFVDEEGREILTARTQEGEG